LRLPIRVARTPARFALPDPGHERTTWLRGKGTVAFPLEHWHIGLLDKNNTFRYGKLVP